MATLPCTTEKGQDPLKCCWFASLRCQKQTTDAKLPVQCLTWNACKGTRQQLYGEKMISQICIRMKRTYILLMYKLFYFGLSTVLLQFFARMNCLFVCVPFSNLHCLFSVFWFYHSYEWYNLSLQMLVSTWKYKQKWKITRSIL